jgi:nucleoid DNA-binding protein
MNISEWVQAIHHRIESLPPEQQVGHRHLPQREIARVMDIALDVLVDELKSSGELSTHRLGRLQTITRPERVIADNLPDGSGGKRRIPARRTVCFRASPGLLAALNEERRRSALTSGDASSSVTRHRQT